MVRVLVQHGAALAAVCDFITIPASYYVRVTALHLAASKGHAGVVTELLQAYVSVHARGDRTPAGVCKCACTW